MSDKSARILGAREQRVLPIGEFELRTDVDELVLEGYASVFDAPYEILGGPVKGGWMEIVDQRAFNKTLSQSPDVHLLVNHEGLPLARTKSGTMDLAVDGHGLKVAARLDRNDPDVQRLATKMKRGDMDEMSFAFRTIKDQWSDDDGERRLLEVNINKGDVSVVNFGANPATSTNLRHLIEAIDAIADASADDLVAELRSAPYDRVVEAHTALTAHLRNTRPSTRTSVNADPRSY